MKLVIAYIRTESAEAVMQDLHDAGIGGITCYRVHGMSSVKQSFLYTKHPFEVEHLPAALKLEVVCSDESVEQIVTLLARAARTEDRGKGVIAVQDVEKVLRIDDAVP